MKFNRKCTFPSPHGQLQVRVGWRVKSRSDPLGGGNKITKPGNPQGQEVGGPNPAVAVKGPFDNDSQKDF